MENYDKNYESSYLKYLDANNLYGWEMSQSYLEVILSELKKHVNSMKIL